MLTKSSRRGAARVSAVWTIVAFVLFFVALGFAYVSSDEAAKLKTQLAAQAQQLSTNEAAVDAEIQKWQGVSNLLGYRGDTDNVPSNLDAAKEALNTIKSAFPNTDGVTTFQGLLPLTQTEYTRALGEVGTLTQRITDLTNQLAQARTALADVQKEKDGRISTLSAELSDAQANARTEISTLEANVSRLTGDRNRLDAEVKEKMGNLDDLNKKIEEAKAQYQSYVRNATREKNDMLPLQQKPDGEVTAVSEQLGRVWINLGAGDRLSEGVVFRVTGKDPSDVKGLIEVVDVQPTRAECRIVSVTDTYDPIVVSHRIWNDLYHAKGQRYAVIAGRFDGTWNEKELRVLLGQIGITVQDKIDINTDFLIAGAAQAVENEDGEQEIVEVAETPVYKDAIAQGLTILSIRDIEQYFRK